MGMKSTYWMYPAQRAPLVRNSAPRTVGMKHIFDSAHPVACNKRNVGLTRTQVCQHPRRRCSSTVVYDTPRRKPPRTHKCVHLLVHLSPHATNLYLIDKVDVSDALTVKVHERP